MLESRFATFPKLAARKRREPDSSAGECTAAETERGVTADQVSSARCSIGDKRGTAETAETAARFEGVQEISLVFLDMDIWTKST